MAGDALVPTGKKKVGAPSLFTPEVCKKIIDAVKAGNYDYIAAEAAGIDRTDRARRAGAGAARVAYGRQHAAAASGTLRIA